MNKEHISSLRKEFLNIPTSIIKRSDIQNIFNSKTILEQANKQAKTIIEEAHKETKKMLEKGYKKGLKLGEEEITKKVLTNASLLSNFMNNTEQKIIPTIIECVKKILGNIPKEEIINTIIQNALQELWESKKIRIRTNPSMVEYIQETIIKLYKNKNINKAYTVVGDPSFSTTDCIIEHDSGLLDASVKTQISNIETLLKETTSTNYAK